MVTITGISVTEARSWSRQKNPITDLAELEMAHTTKTGLLAVSI